MATWHQVHFFISFSCVHKHVICTISNYIFSCAELSLSMLVTVKSDVYSFGVVALEVMMGRHPGELLSTLSSDPELAAKGALDKRLPPPTNRIAEQVKLVVSAALACTQSAPGSRPTMRFVAQKLSGAQI